MAYGHCIPLYSLSADPRDLHAKRYRQLPTEIKGMQTIGMIVEYLEKCTASCHETSDQTTKRSHQSLATQLNATSYYLNV
jgi:hypothetical protein